ncbi:MAG: SCP2 sterol-binding domain-containing protein [Alphaproteobacteria bacterium]|jgi:putative sterol carrier protein|nr:SCP2 sterol-binding domain-containing protein [Alphaproteobacteria bacterium]MDP6812005.1 SCP2 sterol-binding domain-containing protein [Alphaproteobacteria bacterium]
MSLQQITEGMRERVGEDCGLGAKVKWDFGDDGQVLLDASQVPNVVSNDDGEADCTLKITMDDFMAMTAGELDGTTAFMMGKLKIEGDMGIAMRLQSVLNG